MIFDRRECWYSEHENFFCYGGHVSCHDIHGKIDRKMLSINALTIGLEIAEDCYLDLVSISRSRFLSEEKSSDRVFYHRM